MVNIGGMSGINLLITDDDADDRMLIKDALNDNNWEGNHYYFNNGEELMTYLKNRIIDQPSLIFLDLNMPKKNGWETLKEIKSSDNLKHIPVLIFTTSSAKEDVIESYNFGSNTFFTKPSLYNDLVETIGKIKNYWSSKSALIP